MKYIGYLLFALIFVATFTVPSARDFVNESYKLAPEITLLVAICYLYVVVLTVALSLFPKIVQDRLALYDTHVKMACSVMVSLGLVGTFLGLVDMISGIATALSGGDDDFAARMASLLTAISSSLGAMSFAFMTSILGVGISAYSLVAATFVSTSFSELEKKIKSGGSQNNVVETGVSSFDDQTYHTENEHVTTMAAIKKEQERQEEMEREERQRAMEAQQVANFANIIRDNLTLPLLERLDRIEEKQNDLSFSNFIESPVMKKVTELEEKLASLDLEKFNKELMPKEILDTLLHHQVLLEKHNELLTESIIQLNINHQNLNVSLEDLSNSVDKTRESSDTNNEHLQQLTQSININSEQLTQNSDVIKGLTDHGKNILYKVKTLFSNN